MGAVIVALVGALMVFAAPDDVGNELVVVLPSANGHVGRVVVERRGERAVLFLDESPNGGHLPHGRGAGVLKLDGENRVAGRSVSLEGVRATVRAAQGVGGR